MNGIYSQHFVKGLHGNNPRFIKTSSGCKHFDAYGGPENIPAWRFGFDAKVSIGLFYDVKPLKYWYLDFIQLIDEMRSSKAYLLVVRFFFFFVIWHSKE